MMPPPRPPRPSKSIFMYRTLPGYFDIYFSFCVYFCIEQPVFLLSYLDLPFPLTSFAFSSSPYLVFSPHIRRLAREGIYIPASPCCSRHCSVLIKTFQEPDVGEKPNLGERDILPAREEEKWVLNTRHIVALNLPHYTG
jgi:hypothetical protein